MGKYLIIKTPPNPGLVFVIHQGVWGPNKLNLSAEGFEEVPGLDNFESRDEAESAGRGYADQAGLTFVPPQLIDELLKVF